MDYVYLYGSSVRMGHKVYIIPILLRAGVDVGLREEGRRVGRIGQRREPGDRRARGALVRGDDAY